MQPGFGMKPAPVLDPEHLDQNSDAMRRHFAKTISRYGQLVSAHIMRYLHITDFILDHCQPS